MKSALLGDRGFSYWVRGVHRPQSAVEPLLEFEASVLDRPQRAVAASGVPRPQSAVEPSTALRPQSAVKACGSFLPQRAVAPQSAVAPVETYALWP